MYSGYAWIRSFEITSWCLHRHPIAQGSFTRGCTPQSLHTVTLRMMPSYFQVSETLWCDMSRARCFSVSCFCYAVCFSCNLLLLMTEWIVIESLSGFSLMVPSRRRTWRTGNFSKMDIIFTPSMMLNRHFLLLPIRQGYEDRRTKTVPSSMSNLRDASSAPRSFLSASSGQPDAPNWKLSGTQGIAAFWENSEAPLLPPTRRCNFIHPKQLSPFLERLEVRYPNGEIL